MLLGLLALRVFGLKALLEYPSLLHKVELSSNTVNAFAMCCIRGILSLITSPTNAYHIAWILNLVCWLALLILCIRYSSKISNNKRILVWCLSCIILSALLFSPHAHIHDALLIGIPSILTLPDIYEQKDNKWLFAWRWILYAAPITSWICFFLLIYNLFGNVILAGLMAILLVCAFCQTKFLLAKPV